jgi:hypothetical protein
MPEGLPHMRQGLKHVPEELPRVRQELIEAVFLSPKI